MIAVCSKCSALYEASDTEANSPGRTCAMCYCQPAEDHAQALLDWWEAWRAAWDAMEAQDVVDASQDRLYYRAASNAILDGVEPCQSAMRSYLLGWLAASRPASITEQSLAARAARDNQK